VFPFSPWSRCWGGEPRTLADTASRTGLRLSVSSDPISPPYPLCEPTMKSCWGASSPVIRGPGPEKIARKRPRHPLRFYEEAAGGGPPAGAPNPWGAGLSATPMSAPALGGWLGPTRSRSSSKWRGARIRAGNRGPNPGRDEGPDRMIQPSMLTPRPSPSNDSGLGRQSRPSPVIPLGKGEYSLREWRCSPSRPDC